MGQLTFSYLRSEYERIPCAFKNEVSGIIEKSNADAETKALIEQICAKMSKAIEEICQYAKDQLQVR